MLKSKYDKSCSATIVAKAEGKYSLTGNFEYFNVLETERRTTSPLSVTVLPKQLKVSGNVDKNVEVKQPFYINMSLQNINQDERLELHINIEIPNKIGILKIKPDLNKEFNNLRHNLVLEPEATFEYSLYLYLTPET